MASLEHGLPKSQRTAVPGSLQLSLGIPSGQPVVHARVPPLSHPNGEVHGCLRRPCLLSKRRVLGLLQDLSRLCRRRAIACWSGAGGLSKVCTRPRCNLLSQLHLAHWLGRWHLIAVSCEPQPRLPSNESCFCMMSEMRHSQRHQPPNCSGQIVAVRQVPSARPSHRH